MANNFESQKKSARNLVLSPNSQLAIGTALLDAVLSRRQRFDGSAILEMLQTRRSDKEMSGKGTQFATDGQVTGWDTKFSFKAELDDWLAGWAFVFGLGGDIITTGKSTGVLELATQPAAASTVKVGGVTYTFQVAAVGTAGEVQIGATQKASLQNLATAINGTDDFNIANTLITAGNAIDVVTGVDTDATLTLTAILAGAVAGTAAAVGNALGGTSNVTWKTAWNIDPPYTHALFFDETTTQAPVTTLYLEDTADVKYKVPDMAVSDLTLTIPERGACSLETSFIGSGRWTPGAMAGGAPALAASAYLLGSDCAFSIGPAGAPVAITGRHLSTTLKIGTGVVNHVAPGGALYGVFLRRGLWTFSVQTTIAAKETDDILTLLENDTESALAWIINSGTAAQLAISIPHAHMKATKLGVNGNMVIWSIELDQTSSFYEGGNQPLSVSVVNAVPLYMTGS